MSKSEIELVDDSIAQFQEIIEGNDQHGWESLEDEQAALMHLIHHKEERRCLMGMEEPDVDLLDLRGRLAELEAVIAEEEGQGQRWAETVKITLYPIGPDVVDLATAWYESQYDFPPGYHGVVSYCRHNRTNYDLLLKVADEFPGRPQDILKERVNAMIEQALKEVGVVEYSWDVE